MPGDARGAVEQRRNGGQGEEGVGKRVEIRRDAATRAAVRDARLHAAARFGHGQTRIPQDVHKPDVPLQAVGRRQAVQADAAARNQRKRQEVAGGGGVGLNGVFSGLCSELREHPPVISTNGRETVPPLSRTQSGVRAWGATIRSAESSCELSDASSSTSPPGRPAVRSVNGRLRAVACAPWAARASISAPIGRRRMASSPVKW